MVNPNELRIGNKVLYWRSGITVEETVERIGPEGINQEGDGLSSAMHFSSLTGIFIHRDMLLKAGFKEMDHPFSSYLIINNIAILQSGTNMWDICLFNSDEDEMYYLTTIRFFHQLQNIIFDLLNEELILSYND